MLTRLTTGAPTLAALNRFVWPIVQADMNPP